MAEMKPIKSFFLLLFAVGVHAADMDHVATTEISVEQGIVLIEALESAGLAGIPKDELISAIKHAQPDHSFLLQKDVTMGGATRTVQFAIQKVSDQSIEFSILSHGEKFAEHLQSIMNSNDTGPAD